MKEGLARDPKTVPAPDDGRGETSDAAQAAAEVLKLALKVVAEQQGIAPKLIATSSDIDAVAENDEADVVTLKGWRREVFGTLALDLKHGRAMIGFRGGKVAVVPAG